MYVKSKTKYLLLCKRWRSNTLRFMTGDTILLSVWQQLSEMSGDSVYAEAVNKLSQVWMGMSVKLKCVGCRFPSRLSQWLPCLQFICEVCVCVCVCVCVWVRVCVMVLKFDVQEENLILKFVLLSDVRQWPIFIGLRTSLVIFVLCLCACASVSLSVCQEMALLLLLGWRKAVF